jgi:hypothetical protein
MTTPLKTKIEINGFVDTMTGKLPPIQQRGDRACHDKRSGWRSSASTALRKRGEAPIIPGRWLCYAAATGSLQGGVLSVILALWMPGESTEKGPCPAVMVLAFNWRKYAKEVLISTPHASDRLRDWCVDQWRHSAAWKSPRSSHRSLP